MSEVIAEQAINAQPVVEAPQQPNWFQRAVAGGVIVCASLVGVTACESGGSHSSKKDPKPIAEQVKTECNDFTSSFAASDASTYHSEAFLTRTYKVTNEKDAEKYVSSLFNKNGPLAGNGDIASLAAVMAAVTEPAHDGVATDPNYNYRDAFLKNIARYQSPNGGIEQARKDCQETFDTLVQVASYDGSWAQKGDTVTKLAAVRDVNNPDESQRNHIIDMKLKKVSTDRALQGIVFKFRDTAKDTDGFTEILVSTNQADSIDGEMFAKGVTIGVSGEADTVSDTPSTGTPNQTAPNKVAGSPTSNPNNHGAGQFGVTNGTGESNQPGNVQERGGHGGVTPGTVPSFGGGGETPGKTPGTSTPPETQPKPPVTQPKPPVTQPKPPTTTTLPPKDTPPPTLAPPSGY